MIYRYRLDANILSYFVDFFISQQVENFWGAKIRRPMAQLQYGCEGGLKLPRGKTDSN